MKKPYRRMPRARRRFGLRASWRKRLAAWARRIKRLVHKRSDGGQGKTKRGKMKRRKTNGRRLTSLPVKRAKTEKAKIDDLRKRLQKTEPLKVHKSIYAVWDEESGRNIAIKRYSHPVRALRERKVLKACGDHPFLIRFYRYFVHEGVAHVAMEWVDAPTLSEFIRTHGPFNAKDTIRLTMSILRALHQLHRCGFVHGDLHSDNVLVTDFEAGHIKLIDFEHAVKKDRKGKARARRVLFRPPPKLAPETTQLVIDNSYDLYGVGFMMLYMLTGKEPKRRKVPPSLRKEEPHLAKVIGKAMQPRPQRRYRSAGEMMRALERYRNPDDDE